MSDDGEEVITDDEVITPENDPEHTESAEAEEVVSESSTLDEKELETLTNSGQLLSEEEDVVGIGEDIIKKLPEKQINELQLIKETFPHVYKRVLAKYVSELK